MALKELTKKEILSKITEKKEFSNLPKEDVARAFSKFDRENLIPSEKIKLTRNLLRETFSGFTSGKLLSSKDKGEEWVMRKHLSTRERLGSFKKIYSRVFQGLPKEISVVDLGAGINGFSYPHFSETGFKVNYLAVEAMGQLVDLMNGYFKNKKLSGKAFHYSIFNSKKIKELLKNSKEPRVVLLFKTVDSLEMLERDYSKKFLSEIEPFCERIVVSFATESMQARKKFHAKRTWLLNFLRDNFEILDDFVLAGERFIVLKKG